MPAEPVWLGDVAVDAVLDELSGAVAEFVADIAAAERDVDVWSAEDGLFISQPKGRSDARRAVVSLRQRVAVATACELRAAGRELAVWWADLATHAVLAAARGVPVEPALGAAAEPGQARLLAGLAARMGTSPAPGGDDMDLWIDHQLPDLPAADWIAKVLATAGVRAAVVTEVRDAATAIDGMREAAARLDELNSAEGSDEPAMPDMDEFDALWERLDPATDVLARYADVLTRHLPTIRHDCAASRH